MALTRHNASEHRPIGEENWAEHAGAYVSHVQDESKDSYFLRETGLRSTLLHLAGDCRGLRALDVGCGTGWLLDALSPRVGHGSDMRRYEQFPARWHFSISDSRRLCYADCTFDLTLSSLVLMWLGELDLALGELARVTRPGGTVIIALVHPYFYRTGQTNADGSFTIHRTLAQPFSIKEHLIAGCVGPFRYYHRPITEYLNCCIRKGLRISEVTDWHVDMRSAMRIALLI